MEPEAEAQSRTGYPRESVLRLVIGGLAIVLLATGAVATFVTDNAAGSAALLAVGAALAFVAYLGDRLTSQKYRDFEASLESAELLSRAASAAEPTDPDVAERLRAEARLALRRLGPIARSFEDVRRTVAPGGARTGEMERLVADAREQARRSKFDKAEIARAFHEGDEGERITSLGAMQGDPGLRDFDVVVSGIETARSAMEQYHALRVAREMLRSLDGPELARLDEAVKHQRESGWISPGMDRWELSEDILRFRPVQEDL